MMELKEEEAEIQELLKDGHINEIMNIIDGT